MEHIRETAYVYAAFMCAVLAEERLHDDDKVVTIQLTTGSVTSVQYNLLVTCYFIRLQN